jgi:Ca-activated chloride channel family protein
MPANRTTDRAPAFRIALLSAAVLLAACGQQAAQHTVKEPAATPDMETLPSPADPAHVAVPDAPPAAEGRLETLGHRKAVAPAPALTSQEMIARSVVADMPPHLGYTQVLNTERYAQIRENPLQRVAETPVSTFSLDVDTGSYSNVRRFLASGALPPTDAVRIEELVNYFPYDYPLPRAEHPFGISTEIAPAPWNPEHWLLRAAVRADQVDAARMPPANLVSGNCALQTCPRPPRWRSSGGLRLPDSMTLEDPGNPSGHGHRPTWFRSWNPSRLQRG